MRWLLLAVLLCTGVLRAQPGPYWLFGYGGFADDRVAAITHGPGTSLYACGTFSGTMYSPAGPVSAVGITDVFVVKLDTLGNVAWIRTGGGPGPDRCTDLAVNADGTVAITGQFSVSMQVAGASLTAVGGSQDMFTACYTSSGDAMWAVAAGSSGSTDIGQQVAISADGTVHIAGEFSGAATFGTLPLVSTNDPLLGNAPGDDAFVVKYDPSGTAIWVRKGEALHADKSLGLAVDDAGACYLAGQFSADITFDQLHANTLLNAGLLVKFDAFGTEEWFRRIGGGASVLVGEVCYEGDTLWMAGSQTGNNLVFGTPTIPIASVYPHSAFAVAFNTQGAVLGQFSTGSDHVIEAHAIDVRHGRVALGGMFFCQALQLSMDAGGDGLFLSWASANGWAGIWDQATLQPRYAQMLADHSAMELRGLAFDVWGNLYGVGEFAGSLVVPDVEGYMRVSPGDSLISLGPGGLFTGCGDTAYYDAGRLQARGVVDGFIGKCFLPQRKPLDIFDRTICGADYAAEFTVQPGGSPDCVVDGFDGAFCGSGSLLASLNYSSGPLANIVWNGVTPGNSYPVDGPGTFSATVDIGPGCFSDADSYSATTCPAPFLSGITDSFGVNQQDTVTNEVVICLPDLVELTAGPVAGVYTEWTYEPDVVVEQTTFTVPEGQAGLWVLITYNEIGCTSSTPVSIGYIPNAPLGQVTFAQSIAFPQDIDGNDTVVICSHERVAVDLFGQVFMDGSPLPNTGVFNVQDTAFCVPGGLIDAGVFDTQTGLEHTFAGYAGNGWYVVDFHLSVDNEPCLDQSAVDSYLDSIYVVGIPSTAGQADITGSIFICDGEMLPLTALVNTPGTYHWTTSDNAIVGSDTSQSIVVDRPCSVTLLFTPLDTGACVTGDSDEHQVQYVPPPTIDMIPASGLICPGGSVQLTVGVAQGQYTWYGPSGLLPFTTPVITVQEAGTYYCVVNTLEGCAYATALRTVELYGTPYVDVFPQPVLCEGGTVNVQAQPTQNAQFSWSAPLTGNSAMQTIVAPGTYSCTITSCGITTTVPFTITQSSVSVGIVDDGPFTICPQDSALLQATPGLVAYLWQPGGLVGQDVFAVEDADYYVVGFDQYGCTDTAAAAVVEVHAFDQPLSLSMDTACAGQTSLGFASGSGNITWYADADLQQMIGAGNNVVLGPFAATTTVWATQTDDDCTSDPVTVIAVVIPAIIDVHIIGDTLVCNGAPLTLTASPGDTFTWSTPIGAFTGSSVSIPEVTLNATGLWSVVAGLSGCAGGAATVSVEVVQPEVALLDDGPFTLCPGATVVLQATPGMQQYQWLPGGATGEVFSTNSAGAWQVVGIDGNGCRDTSQVALVNTFTFGQALVLQVQPACSGATVVATASGSGTVSWFADAALSELLGVGATLTVPDVQDDVDLFALQYQAPCTSAVVATTIPVTATPDAPIISGDTLVCLGGTILLTIPFTFDPHWTTPFGELDGWIAAWQPATPAQAGHYAVSLTNGPCGSDTSFANVAVVPPPYVGIGPDRDICAGEVVVLEATAGDTWLWSTGSTDPAITVSTTGTYWVQATVEPGCSATDTVWINQADCDITIPNHITPNGDGVNDVLTVSSPSGEPIMLSVFNRWGQEVFSRSALVVTWDGFTSGSGEPLPEGVYFYIAQVALPSGTPLERTGYIHLIR